MSTPTPLATKRTGFSTRLLLSCAAIGVIGAIVGLGAAGAYTLLVAVAPWLGTLSSGLYWFAPVIAQALIRRGGVALLASAVAGLATMVITPYGVMGALAYVVIGVLNELTFAALRYRLWTRPIFYFSAAVSSILYSLIFALFFNTEGQPLWQLLLMPAIMTVAVWIALLVILPLADRVAQTGAVRGLQGPIRRTQSRAGLD